MTKETIEQRAARLVRQEVLCCMSHIVATLAKGYGYCELSSPNGRELYDLAEQAFELAAPVLDYEEAARQAGWKNDGPIVAGNGSIYKPGSGSCDTWEDACEAEDIDPCEREVFEHWAVTDWLADKLIEQGEKVDKDFGNLCIWARTTTGQGIASDGVIRRIAKRCLS